MRLEEAVEVAYEEAAGVGVRGCVGADGGAFLRAGRPEGQ